MSLLTEDTIFTSYQHTEEMGNEPPSVFMMGLKKVHLRQDSLFIPKNHIHYGSTMEMVGLFIRHFQR